MSKIVQNEQELRVKSEPVASVEEATELIDKLTKAVRNTSNGLGLAAVQIGIPKQVGVIEYNGETVHLINPKFIEGDDEFVFPSEGCLSFPGEFLSTKRYRQYTIDNTIIDDGEFRVQRECYWFGDPGDSIEKGMVTIAVQHEMDHFDGRLIVDHGFKPEPVKRDTVKVGRNEPCPCGSGKKYKKCCG